MIFSHIQMLLFTIILEASNMCGFASELHAVDPLKNSNPVYGGENKWLPNLQQNLKLKPSYWDFGLWPTGAVQTQTITLVNDNANRSVYLYAITTFKSAFYSSTFKTKILPPLDNTTFNVVFLPRESGVVSSFLDIQTSFGNARLQLRGEGYDCPYRIRPLVGIRTPINSTLIPLIHMHNPHDHPIQILEVYSSGGQFQLELPSGNEEAPQDTWQIPPFTTKPVIRIRFHGTTAGLHAAYVRIKMSIKDYNNSSSQWNENILIIPLEFEVIAAYGLYIENPILDFGYVAVHKDAKPLRHTIEVKHSKSDFNATAQWISSRLPHEFQYDEINHMLVLNPLDIMHTADAMQENQVILKLATRRTTMDEAIISTTTTNHNVNILVRYHIMKGSLLYEPSNTVITIEDFHPSGQRRFRIRNLFSHTLAVYNVSLSSTTDDEQAALALHAPFPNAKNAILLPYNASLEMAFTLVKENVKGFYQTLLLHIYTNITNFEMPVTMCTGRLHVTTQTHTLWRVQPVTTTPYTTELNLGSKIQPSYVILQNPNPLKIKIIHWNMQPVKVVRCSIMFLGLLKERLTSVRFTDDDKDNQRMMVDLLHTNYTLGNQLDENDIAVFRIDLHPSDRYTNELLHNYTVTQIMTISTAFENITVTLKLTVSRGRLEVDQEKLHFENCFPGKVCSSELHIRSTYSYPLEVRSINFTEPGLKFVNYQPFQDSKILADSVTRIGYVYFEPAQLCGSRCYTPTHTKPEIIFPPQTVRRLRWPPFDELELRRRTDLYRHFKWYFQNLDFLLITQDSTQFQLQLMVELNWPQLVVGGHQLLPTIEVNETQDFSITIRNPSDSALLVDYILSDPSLAIETHLSLPVEVVRMAPSCFLTESDVFRLGHMPPKHPLLIPAGANLSVPVTFRTSSAGTYCTLLHLRNNLTLYEAVWLRAKAVETNFRLGNRRSGSRTPLLFDVSDQHLENVCSLYGGGASDQPLARRIFTARNSGELPLWINKMLIADQLCQAHGFWINDCTSFELKPNTSRRIEIIFTPDFTVNRIVHTLTLKTNNSASFSYILIAELSHKGLEQCSSRLVRPPWESLIRKFALMLLAVVFISVHTAVHIDYKRIFFHHLAQLNEARDRNQAQPIFNLRQIMSHKSRNPTVTSEQTKRDLSPYAKESSPSPLPHPISLNDAASTTASVLKPHSTPKNLQISMYSQGRTKTCRRNIFFDNDLLAWNFVESASDVTTTKKRRKFGKMELFNPSSNPTSPANMCKENANKLKSPQKSWWGIKKSDTASPKTPKTSQRKIKLNERSLRESKNKDKEDEETFWLKKNDTKEERRVSGTTPESLIVTDNKKSGDMVVNHLGSKSPRTPNCDKILNSNNKRKLGKTPGRERRKNINFNKTKTSKEISSSASMSSCSSSTCSSSSLNHMTDGKRAGAELKNTSGDNTNTLCSTTGRQSFKDLLQQGYCITSPWDTNSQVTFRDVLRSQPLTQPQTAAKNINTKNDSVSTFYQSTEADNVVTLQKMKIPKRDNLGPIGSKKLLVNDWKTFDGISVETGMEEFASVTNKQGYGFEQQQQQQQQQQRSVKAQYGYNSELATAPDVFQKGDQASYYSNQQQQQQQQMQYLKASSPPTTNPANNWSQLNANTWSALVSSHSDGSLANNNAHNSWGLPFVRPPPGLENNFLTAAQPTHLPTTSITTFSNPTTDVTAPTSEITTNTYNMPLFDPFGLSTIWADNWNQQNIDQQQNNQQPPTTSQH